MKLRYYSHFDTIKIIMLAIINLSIAQYSFGQDNTRDTLKIITDSLTVYDNVPFDDTLQDEALLEFTGSDITDLFGNKDDMPLDDTLQSGVSEREKPSFWKTYVFEPMRLGLSYEAAYKVTKPDRLEKNRFSFRLEYSKFLFNNFFLFLDTKGLVFMKNDHRARESTFWVNDEAKISDLSFAGRTRDAYLQASFYKTSIRGGIQTLAWGESDFAVVTDEISPIDYREPLNLNIDELKMGQLMLTVDQYSPFGDWSAFFIPFPKLNEYPKEGTSYYYDPFDGNIKYKEKKQDDVLFEYGIRWKKTFGKSDVSIMGASLINNDYAQQMDSPDVITQSKYRFYMTGTTFNFAINKFLLKGEAAIKFSKVYNNQSFQILKKNAFDASFGVDYSANSTLTLSVEAMNGHVIGWNDEIQGMSKNNYMLLFVLSKLLMKDDLSINWATMYNGPHTSFFNLLSTSYRWNDHLSFYLDVLLPISNDANSGIYQYRDQKQIACKVLFQF